MRNENVLAHPSYVVYLVIQPVGLLTFCTYTSVSSWVMSTTTLWLEAIIPDLHARAPNAKTQKYSKSPAAVAMTLCSSRFMTSSLPSLLNCSFRSCLLACQLTSWEEDRFMRVLCVSIIFIFLYMHGRISKSCGWKHSLTLSHTSIHILHV